MKTRGGKPAAARSRHAQRRDDAAHSSHEADAEPGLVISGHRASAQIENAQGASITCTLRTRLDAVVAGDRVHWRQTGPGQGVIVAVEPRTRLLARPDERGRLRPVAANVTQLAIMSAPRVTPQGPHWDTDLIDRYLVAAELEGLKALVVFNKVDLLDSDARARLAEIAGIYCSLDYACLTTSIKGSAGVIEIGAALRSETSVVVGASGNGKSSLVRALVPEAEVRVGEVAQSGLGRHTTTAATLYHLTGGGDLVDSPGIREYGLHHVSAGEITAGYADVRRHAGACRYTDCRHIVEPGCAVRAAVDAGAIRPERWASYRRLVAETGAAG